MKKAQIVVISSLFIMPLFVVGGVLAHGNENTNRVFAQDSTDTTDDSTQTEESRKEALNNRLKQRKELLKTRLSTAQKTRIQNKCKNSQGHLGRLKGKIHGLETSRGQVYDNLLNRLEKFSAKLTDKGLDSTELDANIVTLKEKIETFNTNLANYKQAVADLAEMDCEADPEAFQASLDTARDLRQTLHESGQDIRTFVKETIKQTLKDIRAQISGESTETDENQEQNSTDEGATENE